MKPQLLRKVSLKSRLIGSYLVILAVGGLATSLVGSWIVSTTIMREARNRSERDLAMALMIYQERLGQLEHAVELLATEASVEAALRAAEPTRLAARIEGVRARSGFDFLGLAGARGEVLLRDGGRVPVGDTLPRSQILDAALRGTVGGATTVLDSITLAHEGVADTGPGGLVLLAAAPVKDSLGTVLGTVYGGKLLDGSATLVERMSSVLYRGALHEGRPMGFVTLFQGAAPVASTVHPAEEPRYLTATEPLRDLDGRVVGSLRTGVNKRSYEQIRDRVIASFFAIAGLGFLMILIVTYGIMGTILRPIHEMAEAAQQIAAGDFDQRVRAAGDGEIGLLADSFNRMLSSLRQMRDDLESWGRTLEEKVHARTQELVEMQSRMARTERLASLGMLSAGVAHEINNPLGGVLALTALTLEDLPAEDPSRPNLEEVVRQADRCKKIVKGLLDFSRQSASSGEPVDVARAVDEALSLVRSQAAFFNIELVRAYEPDLPPVMADRSEFQQVLLNIIVNGVQAMNERGRMTVTARAAGTFVEVLVTDTGRGIPPDQIEHIFDPFFTTKVEGQGTGLGLSIAYGIISKHGGTIAAESQVGRGSTFTIRLPAAPPFVEEGHLVADGVSAYT